MRTLTKAAAAAAALSATVSLAGPAAAATSTFTDKTGDVYVYSSAPKNAYNKDVDIKTVTTAATTKTLKIAVKVTQVALHAGFGQRFTAQVIPAQTTSTGVISATSGLMFALDYPAEAGKPACRVAKIVDKVPSDVSSAATCVANETTDTVTFTIPTSQVPKAPKYVFVNGGAEARALTKSSGGTTYLTPTGRDSATGMWTKVN